MTINFRIYFWLIWAISGIVAALLGGEFKETWVQWRGAERDGHYQGRDWPDSLKPDHLKLGWSKELDSSYSSPIVDLTTVYTTESIGGNLEQVNAYDRGNGELRWSTSWGGGMKVPFFANSNGSWIRSTPILNDGFLYVMGMQERLVCIWATDGQISWELDIPFKLGTPEPSFGGVSSPMIHEGALFVQAGGGMIKVNTKDGQLIWSSAISRDAMNQSPFASPRIYTFGESQQLVSLGRTALTGMSPVDGSILWQQEVPAFRGMNILTPTFADGRILTATYGGKAHLFSPSMGEDQTWQVEEKWNQKFQGYMSSPVIVDHYAYLHGRSGRMVCLDIHTGEIKWTSTESLGKYCSMVTNGEKILVLSSNGQLRLLAANPSEYEVFDSFRITKDDTWAHIGLADNQVFIRALDRLSVFEWGESLSTEKVASTQVGTTSKLVSGF